NPLLVNWIIGDHFGYLRDYEKKILGGPKAMEYCKAKFKRKESSIYSYCNLARYIPRDFLETLDRKVPQGAIMMIANQKDMPILPIRLLQLELVVGGCRGAALKRVIAAVQDLITDPVRAKVMPPIEALRLLMKQAMEAEDP